MATQNRRRSKRETRRAEETVQTRQATAAASRPDRWYVGFMAALLGGVFFWSYWPTLTQMVNAWNRQPDYSHGFFVAPLAVCFLWFKRDQFPGGATKVAWPALALLAVSLGMRLASAHYYLGALDGWSMTVWLAAVIWLLGGWRLLEWSWSSVAFLVFMVPLPWRVEHLLSYPLQRIATQLSCVILQCLGQPAISEGNTIWLNDLQLEVEQACSGLRIFVAIIALCFGYLILFSRPWWQRILLVASIAPIALLANALRIVATALISQYVSGEAGQRFTHDFSGWAMIPVAAAMFALVLWYLGKLIREKELLDVGTLVRHVNQ